MTTRALPMWLIENESTKEGQPEDLVFIAMLSSANDESFTLNPISDFKINGFSFEAAIPGRLAQDDPVLFDPKLATEDWKLTFDIAEIE